MTATLPIDLGPLDTDLFIGGHWRPARDGARMAVIDPSTEATIADVAAATVEDALEAVAAAASAGPSWAATPPRERAEILRRAFELMRDHERELAVLMVLENGKAFRDAQAEARYAAEFFRWYSEEAVRADGWLGTAPSGANRILVLRQPVGVSVLVTPWNFPAAMATRKVGPALAAGCTVVLKPASETPLTALRIAALLAEAGLPDGVLNVVPAAHSGAAVQAMLGHPSVRKLSFTGSTEVGRVLLGIAAERVLNTSMELGGNAPFVVFEDADLDAAVSGAMIAKMRNGGEACTAANRFYVERSVADAFADRLGRAMGALVVGPGLDPATDVGPLVNAEARDRVARVVQESVEAGARPVSVGEIPGGPGFYSPPVVLADVPPDAPVMTDETFGPVAPIVAFDDEDRAVELANSTVHGLVSYVYTRDLARGLRVAERIESGMVGLNRGLVSDPAAPFGGMKQSGLGREGAHDGLLEFLETKYIATTW